MKRALVLVGCWAAFLTPLAKGDDYTIEGPKQTALKAGAKGVGLFTGGHPDGRETFWEVGSAFRVSNGQWRGHQLAYDPTGKKPGVYLTKDRDAKGIFWERTRVKGGYHVRATEGKVNGWYLMPGEAKEVRDKRGAHTSYDLILVEKPKEPAVFPIYDAGK